MLEISRGASRRRRIPAAVVIASIGVVLAACAAEKRKPAAPGAPARPSAAQIVQSLLSERPGRPHRIGRLLYAYIIDGGVPSQTSGREYFVESDALFRAEQLLRRQCMTRHGLHYMWDPQLRAGGTHSTFDPQPDQRAPAELPLLSRRSRRGFGISVTAVAGPQPDPDPNDRYVMTLKPALRQKWLRAWLSGPGGGCLRIAAARLYATVGNADAVVTVPTQIRNYLIAVVTTSRRAKAINRKWSECMFRRTGGRWMDESAVIRTLAQAPFQEQRTALFRARELKDALAAAECGYSSGQAAAYAAVYAHDVRYLPPQLYASLRRVWKIRKLALRRADRLLMRRT